MFLALALASSLSLQGTADSWVVVSPQGGEVILWGSGEDLSEGRQCLRDAPKGCLWIRRDGRRYVVTDAAALQQILDAGKPQAELGKRQAALGEEQAALGEQQAALGAQQGELGARQERDPEDGALARQQAQLGRKQAALGGKQAALGEKQAALGRQQAQLAKALERTVGRLIDQLIQSGKARELKD